MNLLDLGSEIFEYTSHLPYATLNDIRTAAVEIYENHTADIESENPPTFKVFNKDGGIYENRTRDSHREDMGVFQAYDVLGNIPWRGDISKELESKLNDEFEKEGTV